MPAQVQQTVVTEDPSVQSLKAVDQSQLKKDLGLVDPKELHVGLEEDPKLVALAEKYATELMSIKAEDFKAQAANREAVDNMGLEVVNASARKSEMLREPIKRLARLDRTVKDGDAVVDVAKVLTDLKIQVEEHDPNQWDFEGGWFSRMLGRTPVLGDRVKAYFIQFEEARTVIDDIARSLRTGKGQLARDCEILRADQIEMRELTLKLQKLVKVGMLMDKHFEAKIGTLGESDSQRVFIQKELLFPLRQRVMALQTQLGINQMGVIAYETIVDTNHELIRGIDLALTSTISGLTVATTLTIALAHQQVQLDKLLAVNQATAELIKRTAARLRKQGVEIQKVASGEMIPVEVMKTAFADIRGALEDIQRFRVESLPKMAQSIKDLDQLTTDAEHAIQDMEKGKAARPRINIDLE